VENSFGARYVIAEAHPLAGNRLGTQLALPEYRSGAAFMLEEQNEPQSTATRCATPSAWRARRAQCAPLRGDE
jgi:hypothetical protein